LGSTVEHITKTLSGFIAAAQPPSPKSTASVCAAFTTTDTTTTQFAATSAGVRQAVPPSRAKASATPGRTSQTWTAWPARRSEPAMPAPIAPSPIKPTLLVIVLFLG
jgi:hypothetical protein